MRIGIDGRALQGKRAGVGRYVFELCRALDSEMAGAKFFIYSQIPIEMPVKSERWVNHVEPSHWATKMKSALWLKTRTGKLCKEDNLDAFWATATFIPSLNHTIKIISTVHDLNHLVAPRTMSTFGYLMAIAFFKNDLKHASKILANSNGTSLRLYNQLNMKADDIILPAIGEQFKPPTELAIKLTLNTLGLHKPYLLAVGTLEPRKNLELLINVYRELKKNGKCRNLSLILVGGEGWKNVKLRKLLEKDDTGAIKHLGYINDSELPSIYAGATAFVFPSIYEGFGIPVVEALACGTRVIASDIPEIREAGGDFCTYFTPTREGLLKALYDLDDQLINNTQPQSLTNWSDGGKTLAKAFND